MHTSGSIGMVVIHFLMTRYKLLKIVYRILFYKKYENLGGKSQTFVWQMGKSE